MATVWMVTLRIRSMPNGSRMIRPGPLGRPLTRPSRNTTPRSYSLRTDTIETTPQMIRAITAMTMRTTTQVLMASLPSRSSDSGCPASVCHRIGAIGPTSAQIGDRGLGQPARPAAEQAPEGVGGEDERRGAQGAEDRPLGERP